MAPILQRLPRDARQRGPFRWNPRWIVGRQTQKRGRPGEVESSLVSGRVLVRAHLMDDNYSFYWLRCFDKFRYRHLCTVWLGLLVYCRLQLSRRWWDGQLRLCNALFQMFSDVNCKGISPQQRYNTACYMAFYMILIGPASECRQVRGKERKEERELNVHRMPLTW